jgi:hypothetical protein
VLAAPLSNIAGPFSKLPMQKQCKNCDTQFVIEDEDLKFYDKVSPIFNGKKYDIPSPTHCPSCRQQRRYSMQNPRNLYKRTCDFSKKTIISNISPDKPYKVYDQVIWWSDKWDPLEFGRDFDFDRPFFDQFKELLLKVPLASLQTNFLLDENSEYTNYAGSDKDCYMIFHADYNRDCYYGYGIKKCESSIDNYNIFNSELCYECIDCHKCYNLKYSQDCTNCSDSYFLKDCIACKNCIGCKNLHQKEYYIFNKKHSKEEYEKFLKDLNLTSQKNVEDFSKKCEEFYKTLPNRFLKMYKTENSFGNNLHNCRNVKYCFDIKDMHDGKYCCQLYNGSKDCMDTDQFGLNIEKVYESSIIGYNCQLVSFCHMCKEEVSDIFYCVDCYHSNNLFGCTGLRHKKYCILNKQYTKEEYEKLVPRIIEHMGETGEWGEFFPIILSHFAYNETHAQDYYPLTKEEALNKGFEWHDKDPKEYLPSDYKIPDDINDLSDNIIAEVLACKDCGKNYRIIQQEFNYYKKQGIPVPNKCHDCRHRDRFRKRNPRKLFDRTCDKCSDAIKTTYSQGRPEKVYCERCYLEEIV